MRWPQSAPLVRREAATEVVGLAGTEVVGTEVVGLAGTEVVGTEVAGLAKTEVVGTDNVGRKVGRRCQCSTHRGRRWCQHRPPQPGTLPWRSRRRWLDSRRTHKST